MAIESATYIDDLDPSTVGNNTDLSEGGAQIALIKTVLKNTFPNIDAAVTATPANLNAVANAITDIAALPDFSSLSASMAELNILDGATVSTAELNLLDGVTATTAHLNKSSLLANITSIDEDLSSVSGSHDTLATAKAVADLVDSLTFASEAYVDARAKCVVTGHAPGSTSVGVAVETRIPIGVTGTISRVDVIGQTIGITAVLQTAAGAQIASLSPSDGGIDSTTTPTNAAVTAGTLLKWRITHVGTGGEGVTFSIVVDL